MVDDDNVPGVAQERIYCFIIRSAIKIIFENDDSIDLAFLNRLECLIKTFPTHES